jgi:hypothetical protein
MSSIALGYIIAYTELQKGRMVALNDEFISGGIANDALPLSQLRHSMASTIRQCKRLVIASLWRRGWVTQCLKTTAPSDNM